MAPGELSVRIAIAADFEAVAAVIRRAITVTGATVYDEAQVAVWSASFTTEGFGRFADSATIFVVESAGELAGVSSLVVRDDRRAEVDLLYVDPAYGGRGAARLAVDAVETEARGRSIAALWADASALAAPVFKHLGYEVVERYDKERGGVTFPNTWLSKQLRPGWLLDEVGSAGRENLDAEHVARYDAKEDAGAAAEVEYLRSRGLGSSSTVVDLGAGTGQLSIAAAAAFRRVIAVDVSPVMLERLRSKAAAASISNLEVVQAGFLTYEHAGPPADAVYSRYALHHLPDFWKAMALTRIAAMLRPGGILRLWDVVYAFPPHEAETRVESWCATGGRDVQGDWLRAELEEHIRDEHSTFTWLLEPMIERAGFTIEEVAYSDDRFFAQYLLRKR